jgi:hypothetical protein
MLRNLAFVIGSLLLACSSSDDDAGGGASGGNGGSAGAATGGVGGGGTGGSGVGGTAGAGGAAPRFPGDPGSGNVYMGFISKGGSLPLLQSEEATLAKVDYGAGAKARPTAIARLYTPGFGWNFTQIDQYTAAGKLVWWSFKPTGATESEKSAFMAAIVAGSHDAELSQWADAVKSRAPKTYWYTFHHEPENDYGANTTQDTTSKQNYRAATRYIYKFFKDHGVTNLAHVSTTYMQDTFVSQDRPWYHYFPDWKGGAYAGQYNQPNLADFYVGSESVVDLVGFDAYCFHGQGGPAGTNCGGQLYTWTKSTYDTHDMYTNDVNKHARKLFETLAPFGKPYAIGEWGYHLYTPGGNVALNESVQAFDGFYQDFIAQNVVGVVHWMAIASPGDTHAYMFGFKCDATPDPTDTRRKAFAKWLDQPTSVKPAWAP